MRISPSGCFGLTAAALMVAATLGVTPAEAVTTAACPAGGPNTVTFTLDPASSGACGAGNNDSVAGVDALFPPSGWILADKTDGGGDGVIEFTDDPAPGHTTWAITTNAFSLVSEVVVVLKQSTAWAGFLVTDVSGTWGTLGPSNSVNDLSHASLYYKAGGQVVPLPASVLLLLSGLGGLGLLGWRRRAAVA